MTNKSQDKAKELADGIRKNAAKHGIPIRKKPKK